MSALLVLLSALLLSWQAGVYAQLDPAGEAPLFKFADREINECSGQAVSHATEGLLWVHNDSGDKARVFGVDAQGVTRARLAFRGVTAVDWEDMALAGLPGQTHLYVGDIGDNRRRRPDIQVYRVKEPKVDLQGPTVDLTLEAEMVQLTYPDGAKDAESLLVEPNGTIVIISKDAQGSHVYRSPRPFEDGLSMKLSKVSSVKLGAEGWFTRLATAADFSPDGRSLALVTYAQLYEYRLPAPYDVSTLGAVPVTVGNLRTLKQCESVCYSKDGKVILYSSEGVGAPVYGFASSASIRAN